MCEVEIVADLLVKVANSMKLDSCGHSMYEKVFFLWENLRT